MNTLNINSLVKAVMIVIFFSVSIGQFGKLRNFALREGIKAVSLHGYKPTYFFKEQSRHHSSRGR
jgi:hypothetical protein